MQYSISEVFDEKSNYIVLQSILLVVIDAVATIIIFKINTLYTGLKKTV